MGAWIEININTRTVANTLSHPTWVRGLKLDIPTTARTTGVAPHVGAWIEIGVMKPRQILDAVAPHVGAWIEISYSAACIPSTPVAPHVGAWIEIRDEPRI